MHLRRTLFLLFTILLPLRSLADIIPELVIKPNTKQVLFTKYLQAFNDSLNQYNHPNDFQGHEDLFVPYDSLPKAELGSWLWAKFIIRSERSDTSSWYIYMGAQDWVEMYVPDHAGKYQLRKSGVLLPVHQREFTRGRGNTLMVTLLPGEQKEIYMKAWEVSMGGPSFTMVLRNEEQFQLRILNNIAGNIVFTSIFCSILAIMLLYNLMLFLMTREKTYLYYTLYLFTIGATLFLDNIARMYHTLAFDDPMLNRYATLLFFGSTIIFYFLFGRSFIHSKELTPKWDKWILGIIGFRAVLIVGTWIYTAISLNFGPGYILFRIMLAIETLFLLAYFVVLWKTKSVLARFFIAGSGVVFIFGFLMLILQNLLNFNGFVMFCGALVVEILIFSLGLGYKVRTMQKEKLQAQEALNRELTRANKAFSRFVPFEFIRSLGHNSVIDVRLGDQVEKEVTVFFSDIRAYTTLSEQMSPRENFNFLNSYLGRVGPAIQENQGFVCQYLGDGIMAIFMEKPDDALQASINIHKILRKYNEERRQKNRLPIQIGIGLHSGPLMMGMIGDELRMDAGIVSDTVNTASRMEGLTKQFGVQILISEFTMNNLIHPEKFQFRFLGKVLVKGRQTPVKIYECLNGLEDEIILQKARITPFFEEGLEAFFEKNFDKAKNSFSQVLGFDPTDLATHRYMNTLASFDENGVPDNWTGEGLMMEK